MADNLQSTVQSTSSGAQETASKGTERWDAMSEQQKKTTFDALPADQKQGKSYYEWITEGYQHQYENWMPWIEDKYLAWFTRDNKASYTTKQQLDKSKVTGVDQVDTLQDGVHGQVAGQVGQGGMLQPVGDSFSKEGINRAERGGKDDSGSHGGAATSGTDTMGNNAQSIGGSAWSGAKNAGGYVGGIFGRTN